MHCSLLVWGVGFGILASMPTGPVAVLILRNTLTVGIRAGMVTMASLLAGECVYLTLFALGLAGSILGTPWLRNALFLAGAATLTRVGVQSLRRHARARDAPPAAVHPSLGALFRSGFTITVTNPAILMIFAGFLASARAAFGAEAVRRNLVMALVSMELGTALWFTALVVGLSRLPEGVATRVRQYADRVAGVALIAFGLWLFWDTLRQLVH